MKRNENREVSIIADRVRRRVIARLAEQAGMTPEEWARMAYAEYYKRARRPFGRTRPKRQENGDE